MSRYTGSVCRLCRREGEKLFLKGERCYTSKCAIERRNYGPGQHGRGRQSFSQYKVQLREKQKIKRIYGVQEGIFRTYFDKASKSKGVTGTELLVNLERRLDNVVYRLGFAASRTQARQLVSHGHVTVNGQRVTVASYLVSVGEMIEIREKTKQGVVVKSAVESSKTRVAPQWMSIDKDNAKGSLTALPTRDQLYQNVKEQLVVELYSRF